MIFYPIPAELYFLYSAFKAASYGTLHKTKMKQNKNQIQSKMHSNKS